MILSPTIIDIDGDYFRADQIAAIILLPSGDAEKKWDIDIHMVGVEETISYGPMEEEKAKLFHFGAVKKWVNAV